MKSMIALACVAVAGLVGATAVSAHTPASAPTAAKGQAFFANVHWDDDFEERVRRGPMPVPNEAALKRAGLVQVVEVERDDGRLEVEGYDAQGREMDIKMDAAGRRVLSVDIDHDDDDRRVMPRR